MKRLFFYFILFLGLSCSDGDLQIEKVDFDSSSVDLCASTSEEKLANTFLFKIQDDEALLLTLATGQIKNTTSLDGSLTTKLSTTASPKLVYRLFTGTVNKSYFCDAIPAIDPTVAKESEATGGDVIVTTSVSTVDKTKKTYTHSIEINQLSLANDRGERLTDTSTLNFGGFTTDNSISALLEVPFSNYSAIVTGACESAPSPNKTRLYKIANDEFISLDLPNVLLANVVTGENPRTAVFGTDVVFQNTVLNMLATKELLCAPEIDIDLREGSFVSSNGTISVSTTASEADANGKIIYTHTIILTNVVLVLKDETDSTKDITLETIPSISFGAVATTNL